MLAVAVEMPLVFESRCEPSTVTSTLPPTAVFDARIPLPVLFVIWQFLTFRFWLPVASAVSATSMPSLLAPLPRKPKMTQFSTCSALPETNLTPSKPVFAPLIDRLRSVTKMVLGVAVAESLTFTPLVPDARMEPKPAPLVPSMVMLFVMVTVPKPPGSRQSISPLAEVFEMAPAKVLQGAVRLQGLRSSPTPETHVRVCACAREERASMKRAQVKALTDVDRVLIRFLLTEMCVC